MYRLNFYTHMHWFAQLFAIFVFPTADIRQTLDNNTTIVHEHLDARRRAGRPAGSARRCSAQVSGLQPRSLRERWVQDVVTVDVLSGFLDSGSAVDGARHEHGDLHRERHPCFKYTRRAADLRPRCGEIGLCSREFDLAFAVVT
jgi:hypothetical protein